MDTYPNNDAASSDAGAPGLKAGTELIEFSKIDALKAKAGHWRPKRVALLAASIMIAAASGSVAGALAGAALTRASSEPDTSMHGTIEHLSSEIMSLKAA